jgi:hypothetical protein
MYIIIVNSNMLYYVAVNAVAEILCDVESLWLQVLCLR